MANFSSCRKRLCKQLFSLDPILCCTQSRQRALRYGSGHNEIANIARALHDSADYKLTSIASQCRISRHDPMAYWDNPCSTIYRFVKRVSSFSRIHLPNFVKQRAPCSRRMKMWSWHEPSSSSDVVVRLAIDSMLTSSKSGKILELLIFATYSTRTRVIHSLTGVGTLAIEQSETLTMSGICGIVVQSLFLW